MPEDEAKCFEQDVVRKHVDCCYMSVTLVCAAKVSARCLAHCKRHMGIDALEITLCLYIPDFLLVNISTAPSFQGVVRIICRYRSGGSRDSLG